MQRSLFGKAGEAERKRLRNYYMKLVVVDSMGGKCQCCFYRHPKTLQSLEFHHINMAEKDAGLSNLWFHDQQSWDVVTQELRKCILSLFKLSQGNTCWR